MKTFFYAMITAVMLGASASLYATDPPTVIDQCPGEFKSAYVDLKILVSTSKDGGCPLLTNKELRKLVNKFGVGSTFAYPAVRGTCLSGNVLNDSTSTITITGYSPIAVTGGSESAQRLFPEAQALDETSPLFINGLAGVSSVPFASGAAMTVLSLTGDGDDFSMTLVLSDRFSINLSNGTDTEDFEVVGTKGNYEAKGRLRGLATIIGQLNNVEFSITGNICLKEL